jgi:urea carboxylase-associated protein 2
MVRTGGGTFRLREFGARGLPPPVVVPQDRPSFEASSKLLSNGYRRDAGAACAMDQELDHPSDTSDLTGAQAHARAQAGAVAATGPTVPASTAIGLPPRVRIDAVVWDETIGAGGSASRVLRRDTVLRLEDGEGDACVQLLVFRSDNPVERLNVADTVKVQWQAYLGPGALLLSDQGRVLMTVVADTSARHDCLGGASTRALNEARHGNGAPWGPTPSARDLLALRVARHGLSRADLGPNINLFKAVRVAADGGLHLDGAPQPGTAVELRAELDVIVALANTPHPLDDRATYTASTVRVTAWRAARPDPDPWRATTPERLRAFENTEALVEAGR